MRIFRYRQLAIVLSLASASVLAQTNEVSDLQTRNKQIATAFYEQLWNSNNTDRYADFVADRYVVHDIGDQKNLQENAVEQKNIADFFWSHGDMQVDYDYQIAEGNLVATRWRWRFEPTTFFGRWVLGPTDIPIINVFRIEDGKIVEIWNHRHDIDTGMTLRFVIKGFVFGVLLMLIPLWLLRRRWRRLALATQA
ncbi:MAG: nuclear transport factor 2 family protein [Pseudomonadota bacterium]